MNPEGLSEAKQPFYINFLVVNASAWMFHWQEVSLC